MSTPILLSSLTNAQLAGLIRLRRKQANVARSCYGGSIADAAEFDLWSVLVEDARRDIRAPTCTAAELAEEGL